MFPDSWIYRGFTSGNFDLWWKQNGGQDNDLRKTTQLQVDFLCTDGFNSEILPRGFVIQHRILINVNIFIALCAEFATKHTKAPLSLTTHWKMEPNFRSWQTPDISRSHLYCSTIAWTPPTAIYREYTVLSQVTELIWFEDQAPVDFIYRCTIFK